MEGENNDTPTPAGEQELTENKQSSANLVIQFEINSEALKMLAEKERSIVNLVTSLALSGGALKKLTDEYEVLMQRLEQMETEKKRILELIDAKIATEKQVKLDPTVWTLSKIADVARKARHAADEKHIADRTERVLTCTAFMFAEIFPDYHRNDFENVLGLVHYDDVSYQMEGQQQAPGTTEEADTNPQTKRRRTE